ncbi:MAG: hypothetical protein ABJC12_13865, partial [Saprospiraceae bacterium]
MKKLPLVSGLLLTFHILVFAQHPKAIIPATAQAMNRSTKSSVFSSIGALIKPVSVDLQWRPLLNHVCIQHHSESDDEVLQEIKQQKFLLKQNAHPNSTNRENNPEQELATPIVNRN